MTQATAVDAAEIELFRDTTRKFLEKEVAPYYDTWERNGILPRSIWESFGAHGLLCVDVPEAYGGVGSSFRLSAVVMEEITRAGYGALGSNVSVHSDIVAPYILHLGSEEQKQKWLPKMVTGEAIGAIAMTEPGAGSDLQGMKMKAEKRGDTYVLDGAKTFITNGQHCDVVVMAAKTDTSAGAKGMTLFTVDTSLPGFVRGRNLEKIGQHAADTSEMFLEGLTLPASEVLGGVGSGFANLMNELPRERLVLAIGALAACEGIIARTVVYVKERSAFGSPLAALQNTRFKLAELEAQVRVNRAYIEACKDKYDRGELTAVDGSIAKLTCTDLQGKVADECLQLYGGYGYMSEYPISRDFVDARIQRIYGGANEIMKEIIARSLLGR